MMEIGCSYQNHPPTFQPENRHTRLKNTGKGQPTAGMMLSRTGSLLLLDILEALESPGERTKAQSAPEQRSAGPKTGGDLRHSPVVSSLWSQACLSSPSSPPAHKCLISVSHSSQSGNYRPVFPFVTLRSLSFPFNKHVRKGRSFAGDIFIVLPHSRFKSPVS